VAQVPEAFLERVAEDARVEIGGGVRAAVHHDVRDTLAARRARQRGPHVVEGVAGGILDLRCMERVFDASFLLFHLDFSTTTYIDDSDATNHLS
jgi:hypothetical protein